MCVMRIFITTMNCFVNRYSNVCQIPEHKTPKRRFIMLTASTNIQWHTFLLPLRKIKRKREKIDKSNRITESHPLWVFSRVCVNELEFYVRCRIHLAGASERLNKSFEITHTLSLSHTWNKLLFRNVFERIYGIFCNVCFYFCDINLLIEEFSTEFMSNMATCIPMKAPTLRFSSPLSFLSLDKVYVLFDPQPSQRSERTNKANDSHFRNKRCESEMP